MSDDTPTLSSVVGSMAFQIEHRFGAGDVANLRRASGAWSPAFWRLLFECVPEKWRTTSSQESRWATVAAMLATCVGLHVPQSRAGQALAEAGWSELRLVRLLEARGDQLEPMIRQVAQYLASKQQRCNFTDIAALVIYQDDAKPAAEDARMAVARNYYRALLKKPTNQGENQ